MSLPFSPVIHSEGNTSSMAASHLAPHWQPRWTHLSGPRSGSSGMTHLTWNVYKTSSSTMNAVWSKLRGGCVCVQEVSFGTPTTHIGQGDSPWLCWSVLLPGTRWCRRHRWGWAVCACWLTTSRTGCHSWPNAQPCHSDSTRSRGAGPRADLSDDHNSTCVRGHWIDSIQFFQRQFWLDNWCHTE